MHKKKKLSGVDERRLNQSCAQQPKARLEWNRAFRRNAGHERHLKDWHGLSTTRFDGTEWRW
jgi:hypothetical protein